MKKIIYIITMLLIGIVMNAQTGIGTIDPKSTLDVYGKPTDATAIDGMQAPRLTRAELTTKGDVLYGADQKGTLVYITDISGGDVLNQRVNITSIGYYYFDGAVWQKLGGGAEASYQNTRGNVITVTAAAYTVASTDHLIVTNFAGMVTITLPDLTNTAADIGRVVYIFNNNTTASGNAISGNVVGLTTMNQYRGYPVIWTGSFWVIAER